MCTRRKTMKGAGGVSGKLKDYSDNEKAIKIIDKWVKNGDVNAPLKLSILNLKTLPNIPANVKILECGLNELTILPQLPNGLKKLNCSLNKLTTLPDLPDSLEELRCSGNKLTTLPKLPNSLKVLNCSENKLTSLPNLPNNLHILDCKRNKLTSLPNIPDNLEDLYCNYNRLPSEYYRRYDPRFYEENPETMEEYVERIKNLQSSDSNINSSEIKEVNSNARNYIAFENIKNGNILVNLKRSANKYNSNYKEYITKNTYNTMLNKTLKHPLTRYSMKKKNIKYYTAKKKNNSK